MYRINILCTDPAHPVNAWIERWVRSVAERATVQIVRDFKELIGGDILFLISCHQVISESVRKLYRHTLVLHASALPHGRGMSPHIWQVLEGRDHFVLSLLNAENALDSGSIWQQREINLDGTELFDEINRKLFDAELELMNWALDNCDHTSPRPQDGEPSFYRRRTPDDGRVNINQPICAIFNLLRVSDPDRYPVFFEHRGQRYRVRIDKQ